MGYYLSEPAPSKGDPTAKNRVWGFFAESVSASLETRHVALETHQENYDGPRKTASGIPLWPSRDPIEEKGGVNLSSELRYHFLVGEQTALHESGNPYCFVDNDSINDTDVLGLFRTRSLGTKFTYRAIQNCSCCLGLKDCGFVSAEGSHTVPGTGSIPQAEARKRAEEKALKNVKGKCAKKICAKIFKCADDGDPRAFAVSWDEGIIPRQGSDNVNDLR